MQGEGEETLKAVVVWNSLPTRVVETKSFKASKEELDRHLGLWFGQTWSITFASGCPFLLNITGRKWSY